MFDHIRPLASDRKLPFLATSFVRQVWPLPGDSRSKNAVDVAEQFADGEVK
jgi:hypothetical protein